MKLNQSRRAPLLLGMLLFSAFTNPKQIPAQEIQGLTIKSGDLSVPWKINAVLDSDGKHIATEITFLSGDISTDKDGWTTASRGGMVKCVMTPQYASFTNGAKKITIPVIPKAITAFNQWGACKIKQGRHQFGDEFKRAVILGNGMALDIAYQDTRMLVKVTGRETRSWTEMHYGLSVGTNDFRLVVDYLKDFRWSLPEGFSRSVTLGYKPGKGTIPVRIEMGSSAYFVAILDYTVDEKAITTTP